MRVPLIKLHQSSLTRGHRACVFNWGLSICHCYWLSDFIRAAICPRHSLSGVRCSIHMLKAHLISLPASYLPPGRGTKPRAPVPQLSGQVLFTLAYSTTQRVLIPSKYSFLPSAVPRRFCLREDGDVHPEDTALQQSVLFLRLTWFSTVNLD